MATMVWLTVGTTVGVVSPLLFWRWLTQARAKPAEGQPSSRTAKTEYAAVSIRPGLIACEAVSALADQRFLEAEAPALPLPGCGEADCQCRYRHHSDRRDPEDRRDEFGTVALEVNRASNNDRRSGSDRRRKAQAGSGNAPPRAYFNDYGH